MELLKHNYIKYGLLMTASLVVCLASMEITGNNQSFDDKSPIFLIYQFLTPLVIWYLAVKARKNQLKGKLSFKQGVQESFKTAVVFAVTSPVVFLFYYLFVNPGIIEWVKTAYQMPQASNATIITIDLLAQVVFALIFGTLYGVVISFFLKSKS